MVMRDEGARGRDERRLLEGFQWADRESRRLPAGGMCVCMYV